MSWWDVYSQHVLVLVVAMGCEGQKKGIQGCWFEPAAPTPLAKYFITVSIIGDQAEADLNMYQMEWIYIRKSTRAKLNPFIGLVLIIKDITGRESQRDYQESMAGNSISRSSIAESISD